MSDKASGNVDQEEIVVVPQTKEDSVKYETYKKVLDQRKSDQARLKSIDEELNALKAEKASAEEARLAEQGKFQEMYEAEQLKAKALQESIDANNAREARRSKEEALRRELGPLRKPEYLNFADVESISMDADGNIDPESVKQVALRFKDSYADLIGDKAGGLPNGAPKEGSKGLTMAEYLKLSASEMKKRQHEVVD